MPVPIIEPTLNRHVHGAIAVGPAEVTARYAFAIRPDALRQLAAESGYARARTWARRAAALIGLVAALEASAATPVTCGTAIDVPSLQA
jgi:hypothetical protein